MLVPLRVEGAVIDKQLKLAVALHNQGRLGQAQDLYERILSAEPRHFDALHLLGVVAAQSGNLGRAVDFISKALEIAPNNAVAHKNRGSALQELGHQEAALASYQRAAALDRGDPEAHHRCGNVLCLLRRWQEAVLSFDRAIALQPGNADAYSNRAFALQELGRSDEALASCDRAVDLDPKSFHGHVNRAGVMMSLDRVDEAIASYDRAIAVSPASASARVNRGMARLAAGDFAGGWSDYESRWGDQEGWVILENRGFAQSRWLGDAPLAGRSIFLQAEQGYGDTIQFCRFATLVAELGARVILEAPAALAGLLQSLDGPAQVVIQGEPVPPFDCHCPLLSLPLALGTRLESIPAAVPYLKPSEEHRRRWSERLGTRTRPRVGLAWSGGFRPGRPELWSANSRRNIPLQSLSVLVHPGVEFYSLQKGEAAESELARLIASDWKGPRITDLTREIHDFADTAALIEQLDLVISVDTATAHLAGALGKPVWILNRFDACWRWLRNRSDSPWYPTARLYRQERAGHWESVLARVHADFAELIGA
jgi:tetratricopeptide (TPR) repeat protein